HARMIDASAVDAVDLHALRGHAVHERSSAHRSLAAESEASSTEVEFLNKSFFKKNGRSNNRTGKHGRIPVDHRALGVVQDLRAHGFRAIPLGPGGEALDDAHQLTTMPRSRTSRPHFSRSARMCAAKASGGPPIA